VLLISLCQLGAQLVIMKNLSQQRIMKISIALVCLAAVAAPVLSTMPSCAATVKNPFAKTCECNEQLFVQNDCTEAFWCSEFTANTGCLQECNPDSEIIQVRTLVNFNLFPVKNKTIAGVFNLMDFL
jgi:hypothetical protein